MILVLREGAASLRPGESLRVAVAPGVVPGRGPAVMADAAALGALRAGMVLADADRGDVARVTGAGHAPAARAGLMVRYADLEALRAWEAAEGTVLTPRREGLSLAWVTLSDKGAAGLRQDASGPRIEAMARERLGIAFARGYVLPDDERAIRALLTDLALVQGFDLILTTGGTGVGPRDVTPEATLAVIEKRLPGFERAMTSASLAKTPHGAISRAVAGTVGLSLVCNLPGSVKAVAENLEAVLPALAHCVAKLQGDPADCGT